MLFPNLLRSVTVDLLLISLRMCNAVPMCFGIGIPETEWQISCAMLRTFSCCLGLTFTLPSSPTSGDASVSSHAMWLYRLMPTLRDASGYDISDPVISIDSRLQASGDFH